MSRIILGPCSHLVLLGGGKFLIDIATKAINIGYIVEIITSPRHMKEDISEGISFSSEIKKINAYVMVTDNIEEERITDRLKSINKKAFFVSLGAAWIFKDDYISEVFDGKLFNLHGSRLPQNRGGGGFSWQIMMGNRFGFCLLHRIDGGIDTGEIVEYEEFIYPHICRYPVDFMDYYISKNIPFMLKIITNIFNRETSFNLISQSNYFSTYWPRLDQNHGSWVDWSLSSEYIERFICAFDDPYKGALTTINGKLVRLKKVHVNYQDGAFHPHQRGIVYRKGPGWICVALNESSLVVESIIDNKTSKSCLSLINIGDRFITLSKDLENNYSRVVYTPTGLKK